MTENRVPNLTIIVGACIAAIGGYAAFSFYAVIVLRDATMTGDIIGTWKSFAVLAFGFWLGSSSGGKSKDEPLATAQPVTVVSSKAAPVHTEEAGARKETEHEEG